MAFINNNSGSITIDKQLNITMQPETASADNKADGDTEDEKVEKMTNRQLVILMTAILNLCLDPNYCNQTALARLIASVCGRKVRGIRQTIIESSKKGFYSKQAREDMGIVAALLEKIAPKIALKLKNDSKE